MHLEEALLATGIPFALHEGTGAGSKFVNQLESVMHRTAGVRRFGSAALDLCMWRLGGMRAFGKMA